ncbi:MAG: OmpP1/FadL family transporter [Bacteroidota bacterium]
MKKTFSITILLCSLCLCCGVVYSQSTYDAALFSTPNLGIGARSLGMGTAYTGVASDFSAMFTNPAGLGQIRLNEVSFGLSNYSYNNSSTYLTNPSSFSNSATNINNFNFVYPFPTTRGSMVFAVGYGRNSDFTTALSLQGFNSANSIIPHLDVEGDPNLAPALYLLDSTGYTPFTKNLEQQGKVLESGGTNNWTVAGAIEAANNLFLGLSLNFVAGSYNYTRNFTETDTKNYYTSPPYPDTLALYIFNLQNTISDDIGGFSARFGLLYKFNPKGRLGISVKTPTWYSITETFTDDGTRNLGLVDRYGNSMYTYHGTFNSTYDITTPYVFSAGLSYMINDLLLSGDVEYTDWTQMSFSNADPAILQYNTDIKDIFRPTTNFRVGGEYEIPTTGLRIRAGYAYLPSPYQNDISGADKKYITGGLGFIVENSVAFDVGYANGKWNTSHIQYDGSPVTSESITTNTLIGTILYRF